MGENNYFVNVVHGKEIIRTYKSSSDMCDACGKRGGNHYTSLEDGISWCYSAHTRKDRSSPKYHTSFSYGKKVSNNPNETFIKKY